MGFDNFDERFYIDYVATHSYITVGTILHALKKTRAHKFVCLDFNTVYIVLIHNSLCFKPNKGVFSSFVSFLGICKFLVMCV